MRREDHFTHHGNQNLMISIDVRYNQIDIPKPCISVDQLHENIVCLGSYLAIIHPKPYGTIYRGMLLSTSRPFCSSEKNKPTPTHLATCSYLCTACTCSYHVYTHFKYVILSVHSLLAPGVELWYKYTKVRDIQVCMCRSKLSETSS